MLPCVHLATETGMRRPRSRAAGTIPSRQRVAQLVRNGRVVQLDDGRRQPGAPLHAGRRAVVVGRATGASWDRQTRHRGH